MIELTTLLETTGGQLDGPAGATSFPDWCYDSRLAQNGQIFVAVKTERRDGHAFIADAVHNGCTGVLCERSPGPIPGVTIVVVDDVRRALQTWASATLRMQFDTSFEKRLAATKAILAIVRDKQGYQEKGHD